MEVLADLSREYGELFWTRHLDVTSTAAVRQVVAKAFGDFGRIDVIVNNAGYGLTGAAKEVSDEQIRHQFDANAIGSIQVVRLLARGRRADKIRRRLPFRDRQPGLSSPATRRSRRPGILC
ncbi:SDR family NAD(P)-dependent oxidoreductase [Bosea caraganae]|nr:SDR family NAD(P)-dependent oxidoreductase [Bosea caraganae]